MKLEDQVVSLELAKELKELGVKQESLWYWCFHKWIDKPDYSACICIVSLSEYRKSYPDEWWDRYSAFTVAELGEMLPKQYVSAGGKESWSCGHVSKQKYKTANTEANSRAKMLIHLIKEGVINVKE
jgi:hypothetical protein